MSVKLEVDVILLLNLISLYVFIWCSGIIESDDIQHITTEIDKAMNFSKKVQLLVESVKKKYRNRYVSLNSKKKVIFGTE